MEFYSGDRTIQWPSTEGFSLRRLQPEQNARGGPLALQSGDGVSVSQGTSRWWAYPLAKNGETGALLYISRSRSVRSA